MCLCRCASSKHSHNFNTHCWPFPYLVTAGLSRERRNWCICLSHIPHSHSAVSTPCHHLWGTMPYRLPNRTTLELSFYSSKFRGCLLSHRFWRSATHLAAAPVDGIDHLAVDACTVHWLTHPLQVPHFHFTCTIRSSCWQVLLRKKCQFYREYADIAQRGGCVWFLRTCEIASRQVAVLKAGCSKSGTPKTDGLLDLIRQFQ